MNRNVMKIDDNWWKWMEIEEMFLKLMDVNENMNKMNENVMKIDQNVVIVIGNVMEIDENSWKCI